MAFDNAVKVFIVTIYDTNLTLLEKHGFAVQIIIKVLVLIRSDMIWFNICENSKIKHKSLGSVKHQSCEETSITTASQPASTIS